jgi:hypothetical protein
MQSVIISQHNQKPLFNICFITVHKPSYSICERSFQSCSQSRTDCVLNFITIKSSSTFFVLQVCDNPTKLGRNILGRWSSNFNCLMASTVAGAECRRAFSWSERTPLDVETLLLLRVQGFNPLNT